MPKFYVTTPIYYVNAKPSVGHFYATLAADVKARWHRLRGDEVLFSTGVDENSQKNVEAAAKANEDVKTYVDGMAAIWQATFAELNLSYDVFIRTTSPEHREAVVALLKKIDEAGDIYEGEYEGWYCVGCESFKAENELVDGKCPIHLTVPQRIKEKNYFFKLSKYRQPLLEYYQGHEDFVQPASARNEMLQYIEHEMEDISISRQAQAWGIRLPQNPEHAVYVWFDALINYLTVAGYPTDEAKFNKFWPADLHIIGKDIVKFHCAIWPAMLLAAGLPLPKKVFATGFFTIDGQKISKSLGNAIDPLELAQEYPLDAIRYYLLRDISFGSDGDFSHDRLKQRYNSELANGLGNLVSRTLNMFEKFWPDFTGETGDTVLLPDITAALTDVTTHIETLSFDRALTSLWEAMTLADELIEKNKPWELAKAGNEAQLREILTQLYLALQEVNTELAPFLPETHEKLTALLEARPLKKPAEPLFARKD